MEKKSDEYYIGLALKEAQTAFSEDEVPIGAVIVDEKGDVIAKAHNLVERLCDPTAHAEIQAITSATDYLGAKYLVGCTMYVTVEPCPMCAAAMRWAQISRVVWGAPDPKNGFKKYSLDLLHPKTLTLSGILENNCEQLMKEFFKSKRN